MMSSVLTLMSFNAAIIKAILIISQETTLAYIIVGERQSHDPQQQYLPYVIDPPFHIENHMTLHELISWWCSVPPFSDIKINSSGTHLLSNGIIPQGVGVSVHDVISLDAHVVQCRHHQSNPNNITGNDTCVHN